MFALFGRCNYLFSPCTVASMREAVFRCLWDYNYNPCSSSIVITRERSMQKSTKRMRYEVIRCWRHGVRKDPAIHIQYTGLYVSGTYMNIAACVVGDVRDIVSQYQYLIYGLIIVENKTVSVVNHTCRHNLRCNIYGAVFNRSVPAFHRTSHAHK